MLKLIAFFCIIQFIYCKDPAQGWLGYATGLNPNGGNDPITHIEAKWRVPNNPKVGGAFFSPWFGIESSDNLNLIQPVNPWTGNSWLIYNEYFQWQPTYNYDSSQIQVQPGDLLKGSVTLEKNLSYTMRHTDLTSGKSVSSNIAIQKNNGQPKHYTIAYFVFEKVWRCDQYPPDGIVTFFDIKIEYNNVAVQPKWKTDIVDNACNCRAHILNETAVSITWDTTE